MPTRCTWLRQPIQIAQTVMMLTAQVMHRIRMRLRSRIALAAETLFLKKQLALYQEPHSRWRGDLNTTRFTLVWLSYWFDWQPALTIVKPETFRRWRHQRWRLLWKTPSKPGRPPIPPELQALIRRMARENVTWGQQRIANGLLLKLGLRVSPRTVRKYMPSDCVGGPGQRCRSQRWSTFIRNHAKGLMAGGVMVETARQAGAGLAQIRRLIQRGLNREPQRESGPVTPCSKLVVVHLDNSHKMPKVNPLNRAEARGRIERSPPGRRLSQHPGPVPAARICPVARVDVRFVVPVGYREDVACPEAAHLASVRDGENRFDACLRAA